MELERQQGSSMAEVACAKVDSILSSVMQSNMGFEVHDAAIYRAGEKFPGKVNVVFSVNTAEQAQRILSKKQQLKQKGYTLRVDLSKQESANKGAILRNPVYQAAVEQILKSPKGPNNTIYWDLDTCTTVHNGKRTFWSVQHLAQLARQAAAAAAAAASPAQGAAAAAPAAAAAGGGPAAPYPGPPPSPVAA